MSDLKLVRRYVESGGSCEHCGADWRLFSCSCGAGVCKACASKLPEVGDEVEVQWYEKGWTWLRARVVMVSSGCTVIYEVHKTRGRAEHGRWRHVTNASSN